MSFGCPYLPFWCPVASGNPAKPVAAVSLACTVAAPSRHRARSPETEGGRSVLERVGGVGGIALLAFTGSPLFAKFFSNLQLLDVVANHQRSSQCAYLPYQPPQLTHSYPPSSSPPECCLIPASSLIHVFIYYFIGCGWAKERRHLVVRTVIDSLKPLPSPLLSDPSLPLSLHRCLSGPTSPLCCPPVPFTLSHCPYICHKLGTSHFTTPTWLLSVK